MAQVLGESGRYVGNEAARQQDRIVLFVIVIVALLASLEGIILSSYIPTGWMRGWSKDVILVVLLLVMWLVSRIGRQKLKAIETQREKMRRGKTGEIMVGYVLSKLPDEYFVINDLKSDYGNLDHVVVGPTGVFVLDAKHWRGIVTADGKDELLVNGQALDKPCIKPFVGRMMGVKEKIATLTSGLDMRFKALFVFTAAKVDARWGKTGSVHCLNEDQIIDYIEDEKFSSKLSPTNTEKIARAFAAIAKMDGDFKPAVDR